MGVWRREGFYLPAVEATLGPVYEVGISHVVRRETWRAVKQLAGSIRTQQIGLVHAWDADAAMFGSLAARWAGIPWITSRRDLGEIYPRWKLRWMKWADQGAARVVVNASAIREKLIREGCAENKLVQIPNVFDLEAFDQQAMREFSLMDHLPEGYRMAMVARLDIEKDVATLIHAMKRVVEKVPKARLLVAGDGVQRPSLESLARDLDLMGNVLFLGDVQDVPSLLRQCQAGVLTPCSNEGLSNSILEYMAASLPVIATDCGGNPELVEHGINGLLVSVGNEQSVAQALLQVLNNPEEGHRMGIRGRERLYRTHQPNIVVQKFSALYRIVIKDHRGDI